MILVWLPGRASRCDGDYADARAPPEEMESILDTMAPLQTWRSARDCPALDRLWNAARPSR